MLNLKDTISGSLRPYKVLILDSEKHIGAMIKMSALTTYDNIRVTPTESITEAIDAAHRIDFDAVVVNCEDFNSPYVDFIQEIKNLKRIIPIIALINSEDLQGELRLKLIEAGTTFLLDKPFTVYEIMATINNLIELNEMYRGLEHSENIIKALNRAIEARDVYTVGHAESVAEISVLMFDHMGLRGEQREDLYIGCLLHDIGKIGVPDAILNKPGKLTDEEYDIVKKHCDIGYNICSGLHMIKPALPIILQHHERLDGSGYPHNVKGGDIDILSQICGVADVYHSLISDRAYRKALTKEEAFSILDKEVEDGKLSLFFVQSLKCVVEEDSQCSDE